MHHLRRFLFPGTFKLFNKSHPIGDLSGIKGNRWPEILQGSISQNINQANIPTCSLLTVGPVEQDFYATVFIANRHSILIRGAQLHVDEHSLNKKFPMKANKNKSFDKLKVNLVSHFVGNDANAILMMLHTHFIKDKVPM